jgi:YgiT-type zinc finger domain-containing protein
MLAKLSKCFRCGSTELELKAVEELVRRGPYVVALTLQADVCARCGERYLQRQDVVAIEDVRRRLDRGELAGFRVTGELLEPVAAGR